MVFGGFNGSMSDSILDHLNVVNLGGDKIQEKLIAVD